MQYATRIFEDLFNAPDRFTVYCAGNVYKNGRIKRKELVIFGEEFVRFDCKVDVRDEIRHCHHIMKMDTVVRHCIQQYELAYNNCIKDRGRYTRVTPQWIAPHEFHQDWLQRVAKIIAREMEGAVKSLLGDVLLHYDTLTHAAERSTNAVAAQMGMPWKCKLLGQITSSGVSLDGKK